MSAGHTDQTAARLEQQDADDMAVWQAALQRMEDDPDAAADLAWWLRSELGTDEALQQAVFAGRALEPEDSPGAEPAGLESPTPLHAVADEASAMQRTLRRRWGIFWRDVERPKSLPDLIDIVRSAVRSGEAIRVVGAARALSQPRPPIQHICETSTYAPSLC